MDYFCTISIINVIILRHIVFVFFFITTFMIHLQKRTQVNKLTNYLSPWKPILSCVTEQEQDRCLCTFTCVSVWVCEEKYRTRNLLAYLPQTQSRVGKFGVISIQKIIHCKYIIYIYTYLNIFTNIPSTIHYTVYFFFSRIGFIKTTEKKCINITK